LKGISYASKHEASQRDEAKTKNGDKAPRSKSPHIVHEVSLDSLSGFIAVGGSGL